MVQKKRKADITTTEEPVHGRINRRSRKCGLNFSKLLHIV